MATRTRRWRSWAITRPAGPLRGGKYSNFEGGTRVPFIVRWPRDVKPGVSNALVSQVDLARVVRRLHRPEVDGRRCARQLRRHVRAPRQDWHRSRSPGTAGHGSVAARGNRRCAPAATCRRPVFQPIPRTTVTSANAAPPAHDSVGPITRTVEVVCLAAAALLLRRPRASGWRPRLDLTWWLPFVIVGPA